MIVPWVLCIYLLLAMAGGTNPAPFGVVAGAGAALFVLGSWVNSYAEYDHYGAAFDEYAARTSKLIPFVY
jgi:hypothetical protein